jgi:pyruvate dehydrogenase (quinone)
MDSCPGTRKWRRPLPPAPMRTSPASLRSARGVAVLVTFTSSTDSSIAIDSVPVLAIAAYIPSSEIGSDYFQETYPEFLFQGRSYYCPLVSAPAQVPRALETAMTNAIARRGVAVIALSGDVALQSGEHLSALVEPVQPFIRSADRELDRLAELLNEANRLTLLCGSGCAGAHAELLKLGETLKAPMVHALRGKEYVEYDNPYDFGMTGLIGFSSGYYPMLGCEALLMLGTDFPYRQFYPTEAKIIQIDIPAEKLGNRAPLTMGLVGDVHRTTGGLLPRRERRMTAPFLTRRFVIIRPRARSWTISRQAVPGTAQSIRSI